MTDPEKLQAETAALVERLRAAGVRLRVVGGGVQLGALPGRAKVGAFLLGAPLEAR